MIYVHAYNLESKEDLYFVKIYFSGYIKLAREQRFYFAEVTMSVPLKIATYVKESMFCYLPGCHFPLITMCCFRLHTCIVFTMMYHIAFSSLFYSQ